MNMSRKSIAAFFVGGAAVWLGGLLVTPWEQEATTRSYLETLGSHETQGSVAALLLYAGLLTMVPALFGLVGVARERGSRLVKVAGPLTLLGAITMPGLLVVDFYAIALSQNLPIAEAARVEEAAQGTFGATLMGMAAAIPLFLGLVLLLVALVRTKVVAVWVPVVFVLGFVASVVGGSPIWMVAAGVGLLAAAVGTALGLLRPAARQAAPRPVTAAA
jgi:hypothetical protein